MNAELKSLTIELATGVGIGGGMPFLAQRLPIMNWQLLRGIPDEFNIPRTFTLLFLISWLLWGVWYMGALWRSDMNPSHSSFGTFITTFSLRLGTMLAFAIGLTGGSLCAGLYGTPFLTAKNAKVIFLCALAFALLLLNTFLFWRLNGSDGNQKWVQFTLGAGLFCSSLYALLKP